MPIHLSENLAHASFGELAGEQNLLTNAMSRVFLGRDENAPIYITEDDQANFEKRRDISSLRQLCIKAKESLPHMQNTINHRINYLLQRLTTLQLELSRREYFEYADKMRAEGKRVEYPKKKYSRLVRGNNDWQIASKIGMLLRQDDTEPDVAIQKLIGYLTNSCIKDVFPEAKDSNRTKRDFQCTLCNKRYASKFNLNRHFHQYHLLELNEAFLCPECLRGGIKHQVNAGREAWSSHVARFHDKSSAPNVMWQFKIEDSPYMKKDCIGKRKRPTSVNSLPRPSKKPRYNPDQKQTVFHEEKEKISCLDVFREEKEDFRFTKEEEGSTHDPYDVERSTHDLHDGEEFYVSGRDELDN